MEYLNFKCPCCGFYTLNERGKYEICPVCLWEDDGVQTRAPGFSGGANKADLANARSNFYSFGACEERLAGKGRKPHCSELFGKE